MCGHGTGGLGLVVGPGDPEGLFRARWLWDFMTRLCALRAMA